jgi:ABC-type sulfate/molybdate transport systems ATPase subunit
VEKAVAAKPSRQQLRARLSERGTPVRVFARPHEMFVASTPDDDYEYIPAEVIHINPAGSLAKVEMQRKNGVVLQLEIPKTIIDQLKIKKGLQMFVRPKNVRVFE